MQFKYKVGRSYDALSAHDTEAFRREPGYKTNARTYPISDVACTHKPGAESIRGQSV